jgi:hypothetical protein
MKIPIDLKNFKNKNKNLDKLKMIVNHPVNLNREEGRNLLHRKIDKNNNSIKRKNRLIVPIITAINVHNYNEIYIIY